MTERRFLGLTMPERARWLYFNGQLVTSIRYYRYKINLYLLESVYVEVFYNHSEDKVDSIELLDRDSKRMKFYTDQIKLPADLIH